MSTASPVWPDMEESHPLRALHNELAAVLCEEPAHKIWGVTLSPDPNHFSTKLILQKFLRANRGDKEKAKKQLAETLEWRRTYFGGDGKVAGDWDESKFEGLAYITKEVVKDAPAKTEKEIVVTWNIYGHVKDFSKTFGDVEEFLRWRVNLMECSIELLDLASAKEPIPDWNSEKPTIDPYQTMQIHDYLEVSFFRIPAEVKAASRKTIELFQKHYPELLEKKFFVNIPFLMSWVYSTMKLVVARDTFKKLIMISYGGELAKHMGSESVPTTYGGRGEPLASTVIPHEDAEAGRKDGQEGILEAAPTKTVPTVAIGSEGHPPVSAAPGGTVREATITEDPTTTLVVAPADWTVPVTADTIPVAPVAPVSETKQ